MIATAARLGLLACDACGLVSRSHGASRGVACPRCGAHLNARRFGTVSLSWALLITAAILYVPANLLPFMDTNSLFDFQRDTILSGIVYLWTSGSWHLALLVFFASIVVPLLKIIALCWLLISVQMQWIRNPLHAARLYRRLEFVGRWSMLDIYVVTVLVALVQIQSLATVTAGPGAIAFGAVVVLTMFATAAFDPRLIWAAVERRRG
jgi:paraquat-inducible protein A